MFLKDLKEESQKILFLELTALIMMAEGDKETTSKQIKKVKLDNKSHAFFQNIDENEFKVLLEYAVELGESNLDGLFSLRGYDSNNSMGSAPAAALLFAISAAKNAVNNKYELRSILEEQANSAFSEYSKLEDFKKEVMMSLISSGVDVLNINPKMVEEAMLTTSTLKQDILRRTAKELISIKKDSLGKFESKEKKIVLFELIGAGYSSGYFGDEERSLLLYICELLHIESEYIEEFLEVSERLFAINKDLAILINE